MLHPLVSCAESGEYMSQVVEEVSILDMHYSSLGTFKTWSGSLQTLFMQDLYGLQKLLHRKKLCGPEVRLRMFIACVKSTMLYGCQVWGGPGYFCTDSSKKALKNPDSASKHLLQVLTQSWDNQPKHYTKHSTYRAGTTKPNKDPEQKNDITGDKNHGHGKLSQVPP